MVAQNSHRSFLGKIYSFFENKNHSERHRSEVAQPTFGVCSDVGQNTVQSVSSQCNTSRLYFATGHVGCSEKVVHPKPSCTVLQNSL